MMIMMIMKNENDGNEKTDIEETLRLSELRYHKIICSPPISFCKSLLPSACVSYLLCVEFTVKAFSLERMSISKCLNQKGREKMKLNVERSERERWTKYEKNSRQSRDRRQARNQEKNFPNPLDSRYIQTASAFSCETTSKGRSLHRTVPQDPAASGDSTIRCKCRQWLTNGFLSEKRL